jgi:hypothetical protein
MKTSRARDQLLHLMLALGAQARIERAICDRWIRFGTLVFSCMLAGLGLYFLHEHSQYIRINMQQMLHD